MELITSGTMNIVITYKTVCNLRVKETLSVFFSGVQFSIFKVCTSKLSKEEGE